ncbi:MAG: Tim44-like domain-containing protein [Betaproteobacteria bacterium]|nr:Tim44-like domain-containing protein [Betaproteobacteria bacterium]
MKRFLLAFFAIFLGFALLASEAEAKRLGGGRSIGMQRTPVTQPARSNATPQQAQQPSAAARPAAGPQQPAPAATGWRKWAGPLAGLAAGIGLAALLSHFGIGAEFAGILLAVLAMFVVWVLIRRMQRGGAQPQNSMQYAGAGASYGPASEALSGAGAASGGALGSSGNVPADFDVEGFIRTAKVNFIRMQAAHDAGNLDDIREFTSPEMFAELKLDIDARNGRSDKTDVVALNAELLDVSKETNRYVASVRFHGLLREDLASPPAAFDEVWHLTKPADGSRGWILSGIEQLQ